MSHFYGKSCDSAARYRVPIVQHFFVDLYRANFVYTVSGAAYQDF